MGAAFEVNKQMCDLEIDRERWDKFGKEWDSKKQEIVDSIFMEKKKMTKAEAFEYLKGKKVYVAGKSGEIQEVLFKAGFSWDKSSASQKIESTDAPFLYMGNEGSLMYGTSMEFFIRDINEEISADDILSIEIVDGEDNIAEKKCFSASTGHYEVVARRAKSTHFDDY